MSETVSEIGSALAGSLRRGLTNSQQTLNTARRRRAAGIAAVLAVSAATSAQPAQAAIGDGIAVGPGRLKLGVDLSAASPSEAVKMR